MQPGQQVPPAQVSANNQQGGTKEPTTPPGNPNSTQNSLQIASIRDGVVIMNDGSFRAVVMANSINFDLMSPQEQDAVEFAYMGFLNSLYFDIQICIKSQRVDMGPYLDKLAKIRADTNNMLLGMLMEDYSFYIEDLVQQSNIMSKGFYIVVPYYPTLDSKDALKGSKSLIGGLLGGKGSQTVTIDEATLDKAKTELTNRVQNVINGLLQLNVRSVPLDTQELIELYYNYYNPDTATRQTIQPATNFTVPLTRKGNGRVDMINSREGVS